MVAVTKDNVISVLAAIGELSNDGIMLFNTETSKIDYCNEPLTVLFDITHTTFHSEPAFFVNHILPDDIDYLRSERERLMRDLSVEDVEFSIRQHDGIRKTLSCNCYLLEDGKFIVGLFRDITEKREHENYIINYGAKKNTLLDMVTHNLSGPLAISQNMIESLERMIREADIGNISVHIQVIKENTRHCIELVNDFLEEEHLVSERIHAKKNRFDLVGKLNALLERFQKGYPDYDFLFLRNVEALYINNDDVKFFQVMNNLISNAVKWSPTGSVIEIRINDSGGDVFLSVRDHGIGIPDKLKGFLFQKNSLASRSGLRGEASVGMGLYIVKKLVRLMQGTISFESREGKGSTFTLKLPKNSD